MLSAGEIGFVRGAGRRVVSEGSNHSTGYCHDTVCWPEVARALGEVGLEHPPDSPISWCSGGALAADGSTSYDRVALFPRSPEHSDADSMNAFVDEFINWFHREDPATHPDRSPARHGERAAAVTRLEVGADPAEPRAHRRRHLRTAAPGSRPRPAGRPRRDSTHRIRARGHPAQGPGPALDTPPLRYADAHTRPTHVRQHDDEGGNTMTCAGSRRRPARSGAVPGAARNRIPGARCR